VRKRPEATLRRFKFEKEIRTMNKLTILGVFAVSVPIMAQNPQIPTLEVCNLASGMVVLSSMTPQVHIPSRMLGGFTGNVTVNVNVQCNPSTGFPAGTLTLSALSMNDTLAGLFSISAVQFDQVTSTGTTNPTAYLSGQCMAQTVGIFGTITVPCHFWIMLVTGTSSSTNNIPGPDIVSFLVFDKTGKRIAYASGPVTSGSGVIQVTPTSN
jgi:hypothetical protein